MRFFNAIFILLLLFKQVIAQPKYSQVPLHELNQNHVYVTSTPHEELVVSYSEKGSDLRPGDYLTHADGVLLLNGGLSSFLKSGEKEAIVPIVDENDAKFGGYKLIGFLMVQPVTPRKLYSRRGEILFDLEEGGPAPLMKFGNIVLNGDGAKTTSDPSYQPPPHGKGACITGKDCYFYNGTCYGGKCVCSGPYTGSFCQLNRPSDAALSRQREKVINKPHPVENVPPKEIKVEKTNNLPDAGDPAKVLKEVDGVEDSTLKKSTAEKKKKVKKMKQGSEPSLESRPEEIKKELTFEDLYGEGKIYPEPFPAGITSYRLASFFCYQYLSGRLPHNVLRERQSKRSSRERFNYSIRFRTGPLGLVFDNKILNATVVEKVIRGQQAELSDVKEGDTLVAIETFNMTLASAKTSQRLLNDLPWPKTLVFASSYEICFCSFPQPFLDISPLSIVGEDPSTVEKLIQTRTFNISVIYPPTLVGEYTFRLSAWTPSLETSTEENVCPLFRLRALDDPFACSVPPDAYKISTSYNRIVESSGFVSEDEEKTSTFFTLLAQESFNRKFSIRPHSAAILKRGLCTFVEKAKTLPVGGADLGLLVNTDEEIIDMPSGKEKTTDCTVPFGIMKASEGQYLHLAARTNEVWGILTDVNSLPVSPVCGKLLSISDNLIDRWPHSVPALSAKAILQNKPPDQSQIRGLTEEGGRVALSGENGWAFFDYHLAMFGPQEVPLGPLRLVMALPPFGCDPNAYTVRITDAVVAILRGGGCSFGIKVINAQKLGAKAVMIVNTDDMKTMRLMALPDEVPLIKIPCIMVSRRIQYYLEEQIRPYFPVNQHLISIQPTGVFGEYETKNILQLPVRLSI